eukprot:gene27027-35736_t
MSLSGSSGSGIVRTSSQLFRDCLRLIHHIAGKNSPKAISLKRIVKAEFKKNAKQTDRQVIESLKSNAVRGLANYLMMEASTKDARLHSLSQSYNSKEAESLRKDKSDNVTP